jgi:23S rRNA pseudouridine1911/1915/1917 synthase
MSIRILFEDHHLIAVDKPAGLLTQAPVGLPSLEAMVKEYIKTTYAKPGGVYLGVPHRLDRPVSGVVLFCRNTKAAQRIHKQFHDRLVKKEYVAVLSGAVELNEGEWVDWIRKLPEEARVERAVEGEPGAKKAVLRYRVEQVGASRSLVSLFPETGRSHQLRVQSAWRGHPIVGDLQYGSTEIIDGRILLHARSLTVEHPFRKEALTIEAAVPESFRV